MANMKLLQFGAISGNNPDVYSNMPINGEIVKIDFRRGDARAAGSLFVYASGSTPEQVFLLKTAMQSDATFYPAVYPVDQDNNIISGGTTLSGVVGTVFRRAVNAPIRIVGSGWGNAGSTISGINIWYW